MLFIRKYKSSDNNRVNLNEFRHTLIKFGVMLPFGTVDAIFKIYGMDIVNLFSLFSLQVLRWSPLCKSSVFLHYD